MPLCASGTSLVDGACSPQGFVLDSWYATQTRSCFEARVARDLASKGLEAYLPSLDKISKWHDRTRVIQVPLFRGYVFVRIRSEFEQHSVIETPGIVRILGAQRVIEPIPEIEIESVRILMRVPVKMLGCPFMDIGDWMRVIRGPLTGAEGRLERRKNATRLIVSIALLNQSVATEVDVTDVEPAERVVIRRDFHASRLQAN
jgi:transcriptional antiterminator NusG